MRKSHFKLLFILLLPCVAIGQKKVFIRTAGIVLAPCSIPGTTPTTAIPVCGTSVFTQDRVEDCDNRDMLPSACSSGSNFPSTRSFWYKFRCFTPGLLGFLITPNRLDDSGDDYDWMLFDVTGHNPNDVFDDKTLAISINGSADFAITGCAASGTEDFICYPGDINPITPPINRSAKLKAGHNYLLMVTNFSNSTAGYSLSFEGGTAGITDGDPPTINNVDAGCSNIKIVFPKEVKCNSITLGGTNNECSISPGTHTITDVSTVCLSGFATELTVNLATPLPPGNYKLTINNGADGNTYLDVCDNAMLPGTEVNFTVLQPASGFTHATEACINTIANFSSTSDPLAGNTIVDYQWDFGDTSTGTGANPTHTYTTTGPKTVKHWIVNSKGCNSDTTEHIIDIVPSPTVDFNNSGPYCIGKDVTFTDISVPNAGTITARHWDMGDGNVFDLVNNDPFSHSYATDGPKTVTLTVTTDKGCQHTGSRVININPSPEPTFFNSPVCLPYGNALFTNNSSIADASVLSFIWNFGNPVSGQDNSSTLNSPSHHFSTVGPYNVSLTATSANACATTVTQLVDNIFPQAHAPFSVLAENCLGTPTSFSSTADGNGSLIVQYQWDFGDATIGNGATPTHTYATAGTKIVKHWVVTDKACNSDTTIHTVYINQLPSADLIFTAPNCQTRPIAFSDISLPNDGSIIAWQWDFNDPTSPDNTSSLSAPSHVFALEGTYNVSLTVTTDKGCSNTLPTVRPLTVNARPKAVFPVPEVCLNDSFAQFDGSGSSVSTGSISNWLWDFGDPASGLINNASNLPKSQHSYLSVGPYDVTLIVNNDKNCTDTIIQPIFVNGSFPVADCALMNTSAICVGDDVIIRNHSTVVPGSITKLEIDWDDTGGLGIFEVDDTPTPNKLYTHRYPSFQTPLTKDLTIRFRAYSGGICSNDKLLTVTVNAMPKVLFDPIPDACLLTGAFKITQAKEPNGISGTGLYSGPGIIDPDGTFDPLVAGKGTHIITYTFTSTANCRDIASRAITVLDTASARLSYSAAPACDGNAVTFSDRSTAPANVILADIVWDMGDGSPLQHHVPGSSFTYTYATWGTYKVRIYNTSTYGCHSTADSQMLKVSPMPRPMFSFGESSVCLPDAKVSFRDASSIDDGTGFAFTYLWDFGDPISGSLNTSSAHVPAPHLYSGTGPYTVSLTVISGDKCLDNYKDTIDFIHPQPKADLISDRKTICLDEAPVLFTDNSNSLDGSTIEWYWDMGDGTGYRTDPVSHNYTDTGTYNVSLYIVNSHKCKSTVANKPFTVYPYPVVDAGPDRRVQQDSYVRMHPTVDGNDLQYQWTPALYLNNTTIPFPTAEGVTDDISYKLTVTGRGGCPKADDISIKVLKRPVIPNTFTPNGDIANEKWRIRFLDAYPNCTVQIFTRTGQKVFESRGIYSPWDGKMNGKPLPADTYYYIIGPGEGLDPIKGYVTMIK